MLNEFSKVTIETWISMVVDHKEQDMKLIKVPSTILKYESVMHLFEHASN